MRWRSSVRSVIAIIGTAALLSGALASCSSSGGGSKAPRVGAIYLDSQGYYAGVAAGFKQAAKAAGYSPKILSTNAADDASQESTFVNTLVSSQVKAILISAVSSTASVPAVKAAHQAGIPVICYNTCIDSADQKKYVYSYVIGDPVKFGELLGEHAADYLVSKGLKNPQIGVVNCEFVQVCIQRRQGFEQALRAKVPGFKIVANQAGTETDQATSVTENMLRAHPGINLIFGESGGATLGAVNAVKANGETGKVVVFGGDMTTQIAQALVDGSILKGEVDISGIEVGKLAWAQVQAAVSGKKGTGENVPAPIGYYDATTAKAWMTAHANGLP